MSNIILDVSIGDNVVICYESTNSLDVFNHFECSSNFEGLGVIENYNNNHVWIEDCEYAIERNLVIINLSESKE